MTRIYLSLDLSLTAERKQIESNSRRVSHAKASLDAVVEIAVAGGGGDVLDRWHVRVVNERIVPRVFQHQRRADC